MAGMPLSAFLANLYLTKIDVWFQENDVLYARYSDDIIIFAQEEKKIEQYSERLTKMIHETGLVLNEKRTRNKKEHKRSLRNLVRRRKHYTEGLL